MGSSFTVLLPIAASVLAAVAQPVGLQLHRPDVVRIPNAGSLGSINPFSFSSALEKEDLLDRLGSKLVIPANNSD